MKQLAAAVIAVILAAGCSHTSTLEWEKPLPGQRSSSGNPVVYNLTAVNRGMYLFNLIPLWSGSSTNPNRHKYIIGYDTLDRAHMRQIMDLHLEKWGADKVEDVEISSSSSGAFTLWIIWRRTMKATGAAVKVEPQNEKTADLD